MGLPVVTGASILCTMGLAPGQLTVTSQFKVMIGGAMAATIQDVSPLINVGTCGMCTSLANPAVASATAAALGVLTPMPCIPSPAGTWLCFNTPLIGGIPSLANDGKLMCAYGGSISILSPGQMKVLY
ncbi:MAG: DUF4280 domain-containing protein [Lachnospiraceae bacterium]|nr:DUF4280 domain-containing protein [Lachnospiraceae bacterium]